MNDESACTCKGRQGSFGYRLTQGCPVHDPPAPTEVQAEEIMTDALRKILLDHTPMEFACVVAAITPDGEAVAYQMVASQSPPHSIKGLLRQGLEMESPNEQD